MRGKSRNWLMVLTIGISIVHILPFYILVTTSFKSADDLSSKWLPAKYLYFGNFIHAWENGNLDIALLNNVIITTVSVLLVVVIGALAAYPLARRQTSWNKFVYIFFVSILIVPPLTILVPLYQFMVNIGGINSYWGIILLQVTFNLPITIFLYTGFINTIPRELDEAAMIDGANRIQLFFKVIIPLLKPVTATVIILNGVFIWNDYQLSVFFLQQTQYQTITVAMSKFFGQFSNQIGWVAAGSFIAMLPMTILYLFLQKYFIQGLSSGAVKG